MRFLLPSRENDAAVRYNLGMALSDTGEIDEAEEHLRKAVEIDPDFTEAKVALGVALSRKRQWEQAATIVEDAVAGEPDNPYALRTLAACLLKLGKDAEKATEYLRMATAILPEDQQSWMNLGQALESQDNIGGHRIPEGHRPQSGKPGCRGSPQGAIPDCGKQLQAGGDWWRPA